MALNPSVLIVAGTDPTGGAGIVRDIETTAHFCVRAKLAITSVNVQDDSHVSAINPLSGPLVCEQMLAALNTSPIQAIKIGMTGSQEIIEAIAGVLCQFPSIPVVFDPVLAASSGGALSKESLVATIIYKLIDKVHLITPNLPELALLTETPVAQSYESAIEQARILLAKGARYVLVKGGHADSEMSIDKLVSEGHVVSYSSPRLNGTMRGTGCTLSTAIAAELTKGKSLQEAIGLAKNHVHSLIAENLVKP